MMHIWLTLACFFLAPAEGSSLQLPKIGRLGPRKLPTGLEPKNVNFIAAPVSLIEPFGEKPNFFGSGVHWSNSLVHSTPGTMLHWHNK